MAILARDASFGMCVCGEIRGVPRVVVGRNDVAARAIFRCLQPIMEPERSAAGSGSDCGDDCNQCNERDLENTRHLRSSRLAAMPGFLLGRQLSAEAPRGKCPA